jgi:hypothetical protein
MWLGVGNGEADGVDGGDGVADGVDGIGWDFPATAAPERASPALDGVVIGEFALLQALALRAISTQTTAKSFDRSIIERLAAWIHLFTNSTCASCGA